MHLKVHIEGIAQTDILLDESHMLVCDKRALGRNKFIWDTICRKENGVIVLTIIALLMYQISG